MVLIAVTDVVYCSVGAQFCPARAVQFPHHLSSLAHMFDPKVMEFGFISEIAS